MERASCGELTTRAAPISEPPGNVSGFDMSVPKPPELHMGSVRIGFARSQEQNTHRPPFRTPKMIPSMIENPEVQATMKIKAAKVMPVTLTPKVRFR